jgi:hypothetical protein
MDQVTLTKEQADLCRAALSHELEKVARRLGQAVDVCGDPLDADGLRFAYSYRLQLTLMALGMTRGELEEIVKLFGTGT